MKVQKKINLGNKFLQNQNIISLKGLLEEPRQTNQIKSFKLIIIAI